MPPPLYLINLARRPDRLAKMTAQFERFQLGFERVDATDTQTVTRAELEALAPRGPLGPFQLGPQCCTLSHLRTYRRFLAIDAPHAVVLEDDVRLSPDAARFLGSLDWVPAFAGVVKLERFGPEYQRVLVEKGIPVGNGREVSRLRSKHTGAAAYVISRDAAMKVLQSKRKIDMDIDHFLFNPNISPLFDQLGIYQLLPALAAQGRDPDDTSDVATRRERARGFEWVRRKLAHGASESRRLPRQVLGLASGRTRLVRVGYR